MSSEHPSRLIRIGDGSRKYHGIYQCICGSDPKEINDYCVRDGHTKSCGCLNSEMMRNVGKRNKTHGMKGTPEYQAYAHMIRRCTSNKSPQWENYGGRGIRVYNEWLGDGGFEKFIACVGIRPSAEYSLDRINVNGQ